MNKQQSSTLIMALAFIAATMLSIAPVVISTQVVRTQILALFSDSLAGVVIPNAEAARCERSGDEQCGGAGGGGKGCKIPDSLACDHLRNRDNPNAACISCINNGPTADSITGNCVGGNCAGALQNPMGTGNGNTNDPSGTGWGETRGPTEFDTNPDGSPTTENLKEKADKKAEEETKAPIVQADTQQAGSTCGSSSGVAPSSFNAGDNPSKCETHNRADDISKKQQPTRSDDCSNCQFEPDVIDTSERTGVGMGWGGIPDDVDAGRAKEILNMRDEAHQANEKIKEEYPFNKQILKNTEDLVGGVRDAKKVKNLIDFKEYLKKKTK